jgi:hypothetical protein
VLAAGEDDTMCSSSRRQHTFPALCKRMRRENEQKQQQIYATLFPSFVLASFVKKKPKMLKMVFFNEKHNFFGKTGGGRRLPFSST